MIRRFMLVSIYALATLGFINLTALDTSHAKPVTGPKVQADILLPYDSIIPGKTTTLGIRFTIEDHWHIYWKNPGDSGEAPHFNWKLPDGFQSAPVQWPKPSVFLIEHLTNYGYSDEVLLPFEFATPNNLRIGSRAYFEVELNWLVCREECIPGSGTLSISVPVEQERNETPYFKDFKYTLDQVPKIMARWSTKFRVSPDDIDLILEVPKTEKLPVSDNIYFVPNNGSLIEHSSPQSFSYLSDRKLSLTLKRNTAYAETPSLISGALFFGPDTAYDVSGGIELKRLLWRSFLFALFGGLILNLMPCVFPVLSIKILSFVKHAHDHSLKPIYHGLAYTGGILLSFWGLAILMIGLKSAGQLLGWGFQLQTPGFVILLSTLFFVLGMNLLGLLEFGGIFTRLAGWGSKDASLFGSFSSGVLATLVATPCTAPFMGSALGYAASAPASEALLIFTGLGIGMASPYVLLSMFPAAIRLLPKPGRWMETLKQFLAFPLFATSLWLLWIIGIQRGSDAIIWAALGLLLISLGVWALNRWPRTSKLITISIVVLLAISQIFLIRRVSEMTPLKDQNQAPSSAWNVFSEEAVASTRANGQNVFVDFTAAWCVSCQVNKKLVLNKDRIQAAFKEKNVVLFRADWTNQDATITKVLNRMGRNGVPVYILYKADSDAAPIILPEILTEQLVLDALEKL